jgi:bis(5'-nucleosyl)-tetraphosphatase (symmetrical)
MALYLIGDIQGCNDPLERLLAEIDFSPSRDTLYILGDLVNRGPDNLGVVRRLMALGASAKCLLGNHDLHLLAVSLGVRPLHRQDTVSDLLHAPDREVLMHWLRQQPLALQVGRVLMVHAGVLPQWSAAQTLALADEVHAVLRSDDWGDFMPQMYGSLPNQWRDDLQGADRLRVIVNALTRLRFCSAEGEMDFRIKEDASQAPAGLMPWFDVPHRQTEDVVCLDDGCVWGGCLSAVRVTDPQATEARTLPRISVKCPRAQQPGA